MVQCPGPRSRSRTPPRGGAPLATAVPMEMALGSEVECVDSDSADDPVAGDTGVPARHSGREWTRASAGYQQLLDAGASFRFPMGGMGSTIVIE